MKRGFNKLKGVTVTGVDATCVNEVSLTDGAHIFAIEAEVSPDGIPVLTLTKRKVTKFKLPDVTARKLKPKD